MTVGYNFSDQRKVNYVNPSNFPWLEDLEIFNLSMSAKKQRKHSRGRMQGEHHVLMENLVKSGHLGCNIYISAKAVMIATLEYITCLLNPILLGDVL